MWGPDKAPDKGQAATQSEREHTPPDVTSSDRQSAGGVHCGQGTDYAWSRGAVKVPEPEDTV